ncbi:uncharacterized protein BDW43DRAFT_269096 [Aspergillus alliaceus]|uniref:uncharacterized protein n=1 Tax=Petromyces alliaceus TaxID=209559 RepID=UPI0012A3E084|nr:uncharacterized protein BDW43DRAFT_269096 [Aspergillus alliaceus]KAB8236073.1 hypothetical protein BDW43DRAFT_269096 [Aspergillus alliaceus]
MERKLIPRCVVNLGIHLLIGKPTVPILIIGGSPCDLLLAFMLARLGGNVPFGH